MGCLKKSRSFSKEMHANLSSRFTVKFNVKQINITSPMFMYA